MIDVNVHLLCLLASLMARGSRHFERQLGFGRICFSVCVFLFVPLDAFPCTL